MRFFDKPEIAELDRREWHLWLLAFAVLSIFSAGIALLMYPSAFSAPIIVVGDVQRKAFFGFCALAVLLLGYLVDRHIVIRQLRNEIDSERAASLKARQKSSRDLLQTLPGLGSFEDRLTMEHRRAVSLGQSLSVVLILLKPTEDHLESAESSILFGDAAKSLLGKLRGEDSISLLGSGVFGVLLPGVPDNDAQRVSARLAEGLQDAAGVSARFTFDIQILNYPQHFKSASEIESAFKPYLRQESAAPHAA